MARKEIVAFNISWTGDKQLIYLLSKMDIAAQRKIVRKAAKIAAEPIKQTSNMLASQVSPGKEGQGFLEFYGMHIEPLRSKTRRGKKAHGVKIVGPTRAQLGIAADDRYYYPTALELGTETIRPKSFMRKALWRHMESGRRIFAAEIWRQLRKELKRLARKARRAK